MLDTKDNQEQLPATNQTQKITPQIPCNIIIVLLTIYYQVSLLILFL